MIDFDELERLCREATPGPWGSWRTCVYFAHGIGGFDIANCPKPETNAELIAALRNAAPELIAMARRYQWGVKHARWLRHEHEAYVAIPVARDADLSCEATRHAAIDAAMQEQKPSEAERFGMDLASGCKP